MTKVNVDHSCNLDDAIVLILSRIRETTWKNVNALSSIPVIDALADKFRDMQDYFVSPPFATTLEM